jgi:hypothetical protein
MSPAGQRLRTATRRDRRLSIYTITLAVVQWLHVILAVYWFGTILITRMVLFPALGEIPEHEAAVRKQLVVGPARRLTVIAATGTVALGSRVWPWPAPGPASGRVRPYLPYRDGD